MHIFTAAGGKVELRTGHPYKRAECSWCSQMEQVRPGRVPKPLQPRLKRKSGEAGLRSAWQPTATGLHCLGLMSRHMSRRLDGGMSALANKATHHGHSWSGGRVWRCGAGEKSDLTGEKSQFWPDVTSDDTDWLCLWLFKFVSPTYLLCCGCFFKLFVNLFLCLKRQLT